MKDIITKLSYELSSIGVKNSHLVLDSISKEASAVEIKRSAFSSENLQFDVGTYTLNPAGAAYVVREVRSFIEQWKQSSYKNIKTKIYLSGYASKLPLYGRLKRTIGTNKKLAELRANAVKEALEADTYIAGLIDGQIEGIIINQGQVTGPNYISGTDRRDDPKYRLHQKVDFHLVATGEEIHNSNPQPRAESRFVCINLSGRYEKANCRFDEEVVCAVNNKNIQYFGGWQEPPCPDNNEVFRVSRRLLPQFWVCQDKNTGIPLSNDQGIPYVGVTDSYYELFVQTAKLSGKSTENIITKSKLEAMCDENRELIKVIEWPKTKPPEREESDSQSPYCIEDSPEYNRVKSILPIRGDGGKKGVVDIIYEYITDGWSEQVMIVVQHSTGEGLVGGPGEATGFSQFKNKKESRDLVRKALSNLGIEIGGVSEDGIKDALEKWVKDRIEGPIRNILVRKYFNRSSSGMAGDYNGSKGPKGSVSGWDYIRWGGPCDSWGAGASRTNEDGNLEFTGPNQGSFRGNDGKSHDYAILPIENDWSKHIRILKWFIGHAGMVDELRMLERREKDAASSDRMIENNPIERQLGDVAIDPSDPNNVINQEVHYVNDASDLLIQSRGFRRNRLRRINKVYNAN